MILLIDTSTPTCKLSFVEESWRYDASWDSGRQLANGLLAFIESQLQICDKTWNDLTGLGVYKGPGSFTGLRIGITVMNSLAYARELPVVGATGEKWQSICLDRLEKHESDKIVLPEYGGSANITVPRK